MIVQQANLRQRNKSASLHGRAWIAGDLPGLSELCKIAWALTSPVRHTSVYGISCHRTYPGTRQRSAGSMSSQLTPAFEGISVPPRTLPSGYRYRVTRYADIILRDAFTPHWDSLIATLKSFQIDYRGEILAPGGNRSKVAERFDAALKAQGWGKENMSIETHINQQLISKVRSHEIDMFQLDQHGNFPGVAVEMEWNNKDPFFDRDLSNFYTLHRAGALAVGIVVTRGPGLQLALEGRKLKKYGRSTTHWDKLMPRVDVGGGGECPLFLVGIEKDRIAGFPS
jgi:hypothetical protein